MLGITMGDPNGIGPEIIGKYLKTDPDPDIVIIGSATALAEYNLPNKIIDPFGKLKEIAKGRPTPENGLASYSYVVKAIEMAKKREIAAIVTAPLNKEALHLEGINFDGHTEILAEQTKTKDFGMMFYSPKIKIMLTTIHKSLKEVPALITKQRFAKTIDLAILGLRDLGIKNPRIAVCGLNPHAGENGIFGSEEQKVLTPVIKKYQKNKINIQGPFPADTIFIPVNLAKYDLIIAHYHDQGLIPVKILAFDEAVNITVGLPIIRTSVDHGTAYDIVGKRIASISSLSAAVAVARQIVKNKTNAKL